MYKCRQVLILLISFFVFSFILTASAWAEITISGPSSVIVGEKVQLQATSSAGTESSDFFWQVTYEKDPPAFEISRNGTVTGLNIGTGRITVMDPRTGESNSFLFKTLSEKEVTLSLNTNTVFSEGIYPDLEVDCKVLNEPPENCKLFAAVEVNGNYYFIPNYTQEMKPYTSDLGENVYQLIQISLKDLPVDEYTFYAITQNAKGEFNSNLASVVYKGGSSHQTF